MSLRYNCALTVDCVVFSGNGVVLIRRKNPPFKGEYALPGGFVDEGETAEAACIREANEETGLKISELTMSGVYSDPGRDPRGRTVSIAFLARADISTLQAGDDAAEVEVVENWKNAKLAFDHRQIISDAYELMQMLERL